MAYHGLLIKFPLPLPLKEAKPNLGHWLHADFKRIFEEGEDFPEGDRGHTDFKRMFEVMPWRDCSSLVDSSWKMVRKVAQPIADFGLSARVWQRFCLFILPPLQTKFGGNQTSTQSVTPGHSASYQQIFGGHAFVLPQNPWLLARLFSPF